MTSAEIRQSFLDFFREKKHTIVPSSSLLPDAPNLLFTNAGMNQFVPIFLGQQKAPWQPARVADTQKCIRAGGKHNDLEDVGLDTYHHTFFEMLGNWSFGDYFKKEAIEWAWELVVSRWKFPAERLYVTVYQPGPNEPAAFDQEAHDHWARVFTTAGLDPAVHVVNGNKKDNFWMMGDTGPCGPCSELHVDLTPAGNTGGSLVNAGDARCIEIWNLVFIQFNANPDGTFSPLPARHVDTGMGFERVTAIIQGTKNFTDFTGTISNYETDIFRPIFDEIEKLSGKKYASTLPASGSAAESEQEKIDIAFRVIADHIRTLSFAIGDGIQPSNEGRGYVPRRILRRAVRYGRTLGFNEPFFYKLVGVLARTMGDVFPEIRAKQKRIEEVLKREEDAFNKTLDRGIQIFEEHIPSLLTAEPKNGTGKYSIYSERVDEMGHIRGFEVGFVRETKAGSVERCLAGQFAFVLYDTYGFPLDLTELMARERRLTVDVAGFENLMEEQRVRARAAQKKEVITVSDENLQLEPTKFLGYDFLETEAVVEAVTSGKNAEELNVILDRTACYPEMGGQVGDHALLHVPGHDRAEVGQLRIKDTQKRGDVFVHRAALTQGRAPEPGEAVRVSVDAERRNAIQRHHTVTHLLHWALHKVVSREATQKGSFVGADKLTFDFNSAPLTIEQINEIDRLVNERIVENASVSWTEVPYADVKKHPDVMQFFGDKYGDIVRVVQIGGHRGALDGYSMELCGGTHVRATGEIGLFRIVSESAIAAGVRRIEAVAGLSAYQRSRKETEQIEAIAKKINAPVGEIEKKLDAMLAHDKEREKKFEAMVKRQAHDFVEAGLEAVDQAVAIPAWITELPLKDYGVVLLPNILEALKARHFKGVAVLGGVDSTNSVQLGAYVSPEFTAKIQAGKIIQTIAPIVGGRGGGRPDNARGAGKNPGKIGEALARAKALVA
ncbi:MAG: alanine--tRNA ligase [Chthoniobacterales bacterium]